MSTKQKNRTATIERFSMWGTGRATLRVMYQGDVLRWSEGAGVTAMAQATDYGDDVREAMRQRARNQGFTHVRYVGDWTGATKPKGGKL